MKRARQALLLLTTLSLAACGPEEEPEKKPEEKPVSSDLALPVTAPMRVREHLNTQLKKHNDAARQRARQLDGIVDENR